MFLNQCGTTCSGRDPRIGPHGRNKGISMICVKMIQTLGERNPYGTVKDRRQPSKSGPEPLKTRPEHAGTSKITETLANRK